MGIGAGHPGENGVVMGQELKPSSPFPLTFHQIFHILDPSDSINHKGNAIPIKTFSIKDAKTYRTS
jgi:hypothetical protein